MSSDAAISVYFSLVIDSTDLGMFISCEGLAAEREVMKRPEGGNNSYVHQLPGRTTYPNIKMTRPLDVTSPKIAAWFSHFTTNPVRSMAQITVLGTDGATKLASYTLIDAFPMRWTGPSMHASNLAVLTETIEIAHHGFLDPGKVGV